MTLPEAFHDLRLFIDVLRKERDIVIVDAEVDARLELAEIHRRVIATNGPALLFSRVKGSPHPVVTNLFGTARRVELAFGRRPEAFIAEAARLPHELMPPTLSKLWGKRRFFTQLARVGLSNVGNAPVLHHVDPSPDLTKLPALVSWPEDGGPFLTLPLVLTAHPDDASTNLGMYRMQIHNARTTGMHFQIGKGGGYHLAVAEAKGRPLPLVTILGGPPALILAAIAPLPENVPELLLASLVLGKRLPLARHLTTPLPIPATAEFALIGEVPSGVRRPEGPFGDHYGYYSLQHDYPVFEVKALARREGAIFPATVVGKPRQEDFFIGDYLQSLLSPLFPLVMPSVLDLWSYGETGYHSLAAARIKQRFKREAMVAAFRILGEGQLALTKFLLVTDAAVDLKDFKAVLECVLERARFETDLYVFSNLSMDTLDYTGPVVNEGSKGVLLGVGEPIRRLAHAFEGQVPSGIAKIEVFCGGCLVVEGASFAADPSLASRLAGEPAFASWPLVVLVDDAAQAARSAMNFLWVTFTRFEPAADIHVKGERVVRHHRVFEAPIVIDARKKPGHPGELFCDPETKSCVTRRWSEYFPEGLEMGDSDAAHLD